MAKVALEIRFDRPIGDDEEVLKTKGVPFDEAHVGPQIRQEIEESGLAFESFETQRVEMGKPTPDQYVVYVKAVSDFEGDTPLHVLRNVVETIQQAYDDGAAGFFEIETIEMDGVTHEVKTLIESVSPAPSVAP